MKKQNVRTLGLIVCTLTYLLVGAAIFDSIESEEERRQKEALEHLEEQIHLRYNISQVDLEILEEVIYLEQPFKAGKPWKFAGSFYYATTVLTTIGYGHSTPKTDLGKLFTMVYAMIGIPLGLVMFNSIGERLNNFSSIVINKLRRLCKAKQAETTEMDLICVVSSLSAIVATTGAAVFSHYEGWSYFHSIYYCFVTLTTIGFGDYVALQQDNSLETKPEYVTFALLFIMFGLAIIAASLNLMVLKFMTMNTEDERRDEQQAIRQAALNVRLDGDVILQQSEVLHWQAEGAGSMEEIRSVCSCTCNSCIPFQQINSRYQDDFKSLKLSGSASGSKPPKSGPSCFCSASSSLSSLALEGGRGPCSSRVDTPTTTLDLECCEHRMMGYRRNKADSIHDLRRSAVSSVLRIPPNTPPSQRAKSSLSHHPTCSHSRDELASLFRSGHFTSELLSAAEVKKKPKSRRLIKRLLRWPPKLIELPGDDVENYETEERKESYVLDEVNSFRVVPKSRNLNHHKRVSL